MPLHSAERGMTIGDFRTSPGYLAWQYIPGDQRGALAGERLLAGRVNGNLQWDCASARVELFAHPRHPPFPPDPKFTAALPHNRLDIEPVLDGFRIHFERNREHTLRMNQVS